MSYLRVTNWDQHQHYKNRKPPWIKFYVALLDPHHPINRLPIPTRYLFDRLLLLAAEWDNSIPNSPELIAKLCGMQARDCREGLDQLKKGRWIKETSTKRRASKQRASVAPPEKEKELETPLPPFRKPTKYPCAECGLLFASTARVAEHQFNVHGIEGLRVVEVPA